MRHLAPSRTPGDNGFVRWMTMVWCCVIGCYSPTNEGTCTIACATTSDCPGSFQCDVESHLCGLGSCMSGDAAVDMPADAMTDGPPIDGPTACPLNYGIAGANGNSRYRSSSGCKPS